jgi:hypothetical protein
VTDSYDRASSGTFSIGELLASSFRVLHAAFPRFAALALVPALPLLLSLAFSGPSDSADEFSSGLLLGGFLILVLVFILYLAMQGSITYGAFSTLRGRGFTVGEALSRGLARLGPMLGVAFMSGVAVALGFAAFIIPGLILCCMLYVVIPVCVVEGRGVFDSMGRSGELTKGYRWQLLGLFLIVAIASSLASEGLVAAIKAVAGPIAGELADIVVQIYTIAFGSVLAALVYYRLRTIKEGVDIDHIADVFN